MKWPHASLTDQQAGAMFFVVPELGVAFALGHDGYKTFCAQRVRTRLEGGELQMIGWPDGTTITYHRQDASVALAVGNLVAMYRASAAMYRIGKKGIST